eukprot:CAMPEP_0115853226 /NCGR_PEP_ID=MMETSP0287-20121206/13395_1 /TAXON_ID=412157 /ORGANISM="Chrysochromulina rotalis, Strain UIO044" /LENGTH=65 /DNA_ID=CAMNT_0003307297 /DNA_START=406 /DNA_END=599 /DNA_ORIENTATION=-
MLLAALSLQVAIVEVASIVSHASWYPCSAVGIAHRTGEAARHAAPAAQATTRSHARSHSHTAHPS